MKGGPMKPKQKMTGFVFLSLMLFSVSFNSCSKHTDLVDLTCTQENGAAISSDTAGAAVTGNCENTSLLVAPSMLSYPQLFYTGTGLQPKFRWSSVSSTMGTVAYSFFLDNNSNFSSPEISQTGLANPFYTPTLGLTAGRYYWRLQAIDSAGQ